MSLRAKFAGVMEDIAAVDSKVVVLVSDISHGLFQPFSKRFPSRYFNIGICEPTIVNMAAGMNHVGLNPFVHTIAPFLIERSYEQLKLDFGYQHKSVNLVSVGSAFDYSQLGCSHHAYADVALVAQIPGSLVFMPGSEEELEHLLRTAYSAPGIKYFRLTENPHGAVLDANDVSIGKGIRLQQGRDVSIAAVGASLKGALEATKVLNGRGISVDLLYFPTFKPFDSSLVRASVSETRCMVTVEELSSRDGLYARVAEATVGLGGIQIHQLAISNFIHDYGSYEELCSVAGVDKTAILDAVDEMLNGLRYADS